MANNLNVEKVINIEAVKERINFLYEDMRKLSVELLELNINQFDGKISKSDAEQKLTTLANKHIDIESEIHTLKKLLEKYDKQKPQQSM